jgi:hypothetical protein
MRKPATLTTLALVVVPLAIAPAAYAQATRTWVSGVGDDVNPCSRTAPCKTFAGAISRTAAGGEISVLDPGGFGAVTITKSITINGDGTLAGILAAGTNGIIVNAAAGDRVVIRNISINGAGTGINGIRYLAGGQLTVEKVTISGFTTRGIDVALAGSGKAFVQDTTITNAATGIRVSTTAGQALATLDNVRLEGLTTGLDVATGATFVTVKRSTINGTTVNGVVASGASATVTLEDNMIAFNNGSAVNASVAGARIRISNNTIVNNSLGVAIAAGAFVETASNNRIDGNTASTPPNDTFTVQ